MLALLSSSYGERRSISALMGNLYATRQRQGESCTAFSHRPREAYDTLIARQRDMGVTASDSRLLRDHFADSLVDSILRRQLRERLACNADVTPHCPSLLKPATTKEKAGKPQPTAVESPAAVEGRDSLIGRTVGECPVVQFNLLGVGVKAVVDTGSQVSTIIESYYLQHVEPRGRELKRDLCLRLTAANGLELPYTGYFVATITIAGQVIPERVFLVIKDPPGGTKKPCLLGMNVLKEITGWEGLGRAPGPDLVAQKLTIGGQGGKYARLAEDVN
ncbi:Pol polyprotein [Plakobranchus ocellatus]|uniref:Pol polyprotein n=1 Tax=Plakobranchus ocellatus TaxID=259542 RepID=A0AAV4CYH5_9GAST|nr:Pol polyprotein [Plakobranchus ocellatus]